MRLPLFDTPAPVLPASGPRSMAAVRVLRISVTDRCNYRCVYCMPAEGVPWLPKEGVLSFEQILRISRVAADRWGVRRFKLTGGEPTVRRGIVDLVGMFARSGLADDLSLTTNGQLLEHLARPLREAGLGRVTISLDSLRADRFAGVTRTGDLAAVLRGIEAAVDAGFQSVKINCVVMRGVNDDEVADFAQLAQTMPVTVRFIEYMPLGDSAVGQTGGRVADDETGPAGGCGAQDRGDVFVSHDEIVAAIESRFGPLQLVPRDDEPGVGPAVPYALPNARGRLGFISAMSAPFCDTCNRLRLTAAGVLRSCLFDGGEVDLMPILQDATTDTDARIAQAMADCVRLKPVSHSGHGNAQMSRIGG
jgi:cyclic pyranopterin phosphate synthase